MIELFEQHEKTLDRHSSKGNQLKWKDGDLWYKADYAGYEGLAEFIISHLLEKSSLKNDEFVLYDLEQIKYKDRTFNGSCSRDFLTDAWQIITLERLYKNYNGRSLYQCIWGISGIENRIDFFVNEMHRITGLPGWGEYISKLITIDTFFLNEDRHMHNIAVLMNGNAEYRFCPIFDNGAGLLSDTTLDYPLPGDVYKLIDAARSKTFSSDFDEQLDAVEHLFGRTIHFKFVKKDVDMLIEKAGIYDEKVKERVRTIIYDRIRKYEYLFHE